MTGPLLGATIATDSLAKSEEAYSSLLGYRGERETIDVDLAQRLGYPALEGRTMATLRPECGGERFIRLVEGGADPKPLASFGWIALELIVRDLDALADKLADGPFDIIGPPRTLDFDFTDDIRAMQVKGPSGEVLYLTEVLGDVPGFDLPSADSDVGVPFVAVAGVPDLTRWCTTADTELGAQCGPAFEARVEVISAALGMDESVRHSLTTMPLGNASYLEIDTLPAPAHERAADEPRGIIAVALGTNGGGAKPQTLGPLRFEWHVCG